MFGNWANNRENRGEREELGSRDTMGTQIHIFEFFSSDSPWVLFLLKATWVVFLCHLQSRKPRQMHSIKWAAQVRNIKGTQTLFQFPFSPFI